MTSGPSTAPAAVTRPRWRQGATVISLGVSAALLVWLYRGLDVRLIGETLLRADRFWLVISVGMILPITIMRALRFLLVAPKGALAGLVEALRLTLVASALNVFLPAKTGDLIKSYSVARTSATPAGVALSVVVYERLCDLFSLMKWCVVGWLVGRPQVSGMPPWVWFFFVAGAAVCGLLVTSEPAAVVLRAVLGRLLPEGRLARVHDLADGWPALLAVLRGRRRYIVSLSLLLWSVHLTQIWMFTVTLSAPIPIMICASLSALALMAGQVPFTIAGLGTRDVALVVLLAGYMAPESAAAMGVLIATRGLLPPVFGAPIMRPYLESVVTDAQRWRRRMEQPS